LIDSGLLKLGTHPSCKILLAEKIKRRGGVIRKNGVALTSALRSKLIPNVKEIRQHIFFGMAVKDIAKKFGTDGGTMKRFMAQEDLLKLSHKKLVAI